MFVPRGNFLYLFSTVFVSHEDLDMSIALGQLGTYPTLRERGMGGGLAKSPEFILFGVLLTSPKHSKQT